MASATVLLSLTHGEAQTLLDLMCRIGGASKTRRRYADSIANALRDAGVNESGKDDVDETKGTNSIYFK